MENQNISISVVVPFYKGNRYINELLSNVDTTAKLLRESCGAEMEVIIINDSPDTPVEINTAVSLPVRVIPNERNLGIQGSRIHGIREAAGQWIQLLDQDDLLIPENYPAQFALAKTHAVTVGNALYYRGDEPQLLYANGRVMAYYLQQTRFVMIRDLIASPGHCLIRKDVFPAYWMENPMHTNGADDYYLWMLLFDRGVPFTVHNKPVYIHRNSEEGNLSFDLERMHASNCEMCDLLEKAPGYAPKKLAALRRSIVFKYLYDTKKLKLHQWLCYADKVFDNGIYKIVTLFLSRLR